MTKGILIHIFGLLGQHSLIITALLLVYLLNAKEQELGFPSGPVVKTMLLPLQGEGGHRFHPWWVTKIPACCVVPPPPKKAGVVVNLIKRKVPELILKRVGPAGNSAWYSGDLLEEEFQLHSLLSLNVSFPSGSQVVNICSFCQWNEYPMILFCVSKIWSWRIWTNS